MTLWTKLKEFVERVAHNDAPPASLREEELRLAAAALLVRAVVVDGHVDAEERRTLKRLLKERFELSSEEAGRLMGEARQREEEAVDLYGFTSVLCRELDQEGRKRIVEMLWEVVMADRVVHEFEDNLVWRAAELLGVSTRDRVMLKKKVAGRYARGTGQ